MSLYTHDIFFSDSNLTFDQKKELIKDALLLSYNWWADEIRGGGQRQKIEDADFHKTLDEMDENSIFRIIHRKGFLDDKWHLQIVFNEMSKFLWVDVDEEYVEHFKKKYKLKQI